MMTDFAFEVTDLLRASAAQAIGGPTAVTSHRVDDARTALVLVDVTVVAAGGSLSVDIETSDDDVTFYRIASLPVLNVVGVHAERIENFSRFLRISSTVAGAAVTWSAKASRKT